MIKGLRQQASHHETVSKDPRESHAHASAPMDFFAYFTLAANAPESGPT